jgi:hypothetical protein
MEPYRAFDEVILASLGVVEAVLKKDREKACN